MEFLILKIMTKFCQCQYLDLRLSLIDLSNKIVPFFKTFQRNKTIHILKAWIKSNVAHCIISRQVEYF